MEQSHNENNNQNIPIINEYCKFHQGQILSLLCNDKLCQKSGLICVICQYNQHKNHHAKPVFWMLNKIKNDSQITSTVLKFTTKIDILRLEAEQILKQDTNLQINDKLQVQKAIDYVFKKHHKQLSIRKSAYRKIVDKSYKLEQIKSYLKQYVIYSAENQQQKSMSNLQLFLKDILSITQQRIKQFKYTIKQKLQLNDILQILLSEAQRKIKYTFSPQHKHKNIIITEQLKATQKNNYNTNFAVVEPLIQGKNKKCRGKKSIKFKIDKLVSWISLGVGYLSFVQKSNYYFSTGGIGHGGYLISNNGYTWHHSDSSFNSFNIQWDFKQGDIITVTVQPRKKIIIYSKEGSSSNYQLAFDPISGEQLYFLVSLCSHDQSVSIQQ